MDTGSVHDDVWLMLSMDPELCGACCLNSWESVLSSRVYPIVSAHFDSFSPIHQGLI